MYANEETKHAVDLYISRARREHGPDAEPAMPCRYESGRDGDTVTLRNANGILARYRVREDGRLRLLSD